jgi:hypothetical protein
VIVIYLTAVLLIVAGLIVVLSMAVAVGTSTSRQEIIKIFCIKFNFFSYIDIDFMLP